ncbi:hypothetical protein [Actinopolymorpha pittospori]|uniref:Uncharacterized protein n=1 Tax=Actinopolymorpha pittospori TaxID=648752 RepID=A0A927MTX5_9ACTN|nr:hypothetical protein [Actinopolymorpha pittospori]MBE1606247.1 hypothetical protein [Actinopolymorpha pittospori]
MASAKVRLDHAGIAEVLRSGEVRAALDDLAGTVAGNASSSPEWQRYAARGEVRVASYTTDRAAAAVTLAHPGGLGMQAKHGTLTRAAGAAGLEVRERG